MKNKILNFIIALLSIIVPFVSGAQISIKGRVIDSNRNPLPFTNIVLSNRNNGTITNANGEFELKNVLVSDTIKITNISFIPKKISVAELNFNYEIVLTDSIKMLDEIIIRDFNKFNRIEKLGFAAYSKNGTYNFIPGSQLALLIHNPVKKDGWLQKINFAIEDFGKCKNSMRLRVLKFDTLNQCPGFDLLQQDLIIESKDLKKKNSIDISTNKLIFPPEGVFILIEWLSPQNDCNLNSYVTIMANNKSMENLVWINYKDRQWSHSKIPKHLNGSYSTPNIGIEVAY